MPAHAQFTVETLALHLLFERAQSLVDIIVADLDLDDDRSPRRDERICAAAAVSTDAGGPIPSSVSGGNMNDGLKGV